MKRRQVIKQLGIMTVGLSVLPACDFEKVPFYPNIPLEKPQYRLLRTFINALLPIDPSLEMDPNGATDFTLMMINDCYAPKFIALYKSGFDRFTTWLEERQLLKNEKLEGLQWEDLILVIEEAEEIETLEEPLPLPYFLSTTKGLAVQYFTSSAYFMENHLDYRFIPGKYLGCVEI